MEEVFFTNFYALDLSILTQLETNSSQTLLGAKKNILAWKKGSNVFRLLPENMSKLTFNEYSETQSKWSDRDWNLCTSLRGCLVCDNGICHLCQKNYVLSANACVYCDYPNIEANNVCTLPDHTVNIVYPNSSFSLITLIDMLFT